MFTINDDMSIYVTRGDIAFFTVTAEKDGSPYKFQAGDVVRIKVMQKKACENVAFQKDFPITEETETVEIYLTKAETKIGDVISKPVDYWYEIELNPLTNPQTIIGYDDDGAKIFKLFPEGKDIEPTEVTEEDVPIVDEALDLTSTRPVQNQAISRAIISLNDDVQKLKGLQSEIAVERSRLDNLAKLKEGSTTGDAELADIRVGADGTVYENAGAAIRGQIKLLTEKIEDISENDNSSVQSKEGIPLAVSSISEAVINTADIVLSPNTKYLINVYDVKNTSVQVDSISYFDNKELALTTIAKKDSGYEFVTGDSCSYFLQFIVTGDSWDGTDEEVARNVLQGIILKNAKDDEEDSKLDAETIKDALGYTPVHSLYAYESDGVVTMDLEDSEGNTITGLDMVGNGVTLDLKEKDPNKHYELQISMQKAEAVEAGNTKPVTSDAVKKAMDASGFIDKTVNDLANYYLKSETYTRDEVKQMISAIPKFSIKAVPSLPTTGISITTVYLLKSGEESQNLYTEYIFQVDANAPSEPTDDGLYEETAGSWEILGTQTINLSGYALKKDLPTLLSQLSDDAEHRLVTDSEKAAWSAKSNFSGNYDDLNGKPTVTNGKDGLSMHRYQYNMHVSTLADAPNDDTLGMYSIADLLTSRTAQIDDIVLDAAGNVFHITDIYTSTFDAEFLYSIKGENGAAGANGANGADGKSAYKYAQDGGYTGTEDEFAEKLANEYAPASETITMTGVDADGVSRNYVVYGYEVTAAEK